MSPGRNGSPRPSTGTTDGHCPVRPIAWMVCRLPRPSISVARAESDEDRQRLASCSAQPSRGMLVGYGRRTSRSIAPAVSYAVARAPDVPTSTDTSASVWAVDVAIALPADQLLRLDLVAVERDQRTVERARRVVAARVDDNRAPDPPDA